MSQPRPVYPNATSMVTRRVHQRQLLLLEDPVVAQVIKFTAGYCAQKHGIELSALLAESNHIHQVPCDTQAALPDFCRDFHSFTARQLNVYFQLHDSFWSGQQTNVVVNEDPEDILERIKYVMGNPVADGLERRGQDHKSLRLRWPRPPEVVKRPPFFWRPSEKGGTVPDTVELVFHRPRGFDALSDEELDHLIETRIQTYEQEMREAREAAGLPFLCDSPEANRDPRAFPKSPPRLFRLAPLIGARLKAVRLRAIERLRAFRQAHAQARAEMRAGKTDVVFPYGTFLAARRWNVKLAPAPS